MEPIILKNVKKKFKKRTVLNDVNFTLNGGINILVGENGAGKSTLFYLITGVMKANSGVILLNGKDPWKYHSIAMKDVTFMPERPTFLGGSSIREYIYWFANLNGTGTEQIIYYMDLFGIHDIIGSTFQSLSMGENQLIMLACYLSTNSSIFILDEPNSNVDVHKRSVISDAIKEKAKKSNSLFLISTHIFDDLFTIYDRILLLHNGKVKNIDKSEGLSYISMVRTDNNKLMFDLIKEYDKNATFKHGSIFTSLGIDGCTKIADEHGIRILSYYSLPEDQRLLYE